MGSICSERLADIWGPMQGLNSALMSTEKSLYEKDAMLSFHTTNFRKTESQSR